MHRRTFLKTGATATGVLAVPHLSLAFEGGEKSPAEGSVMTITGAVDPEDLGRTLPHEHVMVDFAGVDTVGPDRYDRTEVVETVRPYLNDLVDAGAQTLMECTPAYLGRDPRVLHQLAVETGLQIVTNTGYYGARDDQHVPDHAYADSVDDLAARWVREWKEGIGETDVRPGFIKIGVDDGRLSEIDAKLVRAACRAHRQTGLTIAAHTGPATPAFEQLDILAEEKVDPSAWIWVHAQNEKDVSRHVEAARRGAWVEFDGYESEHTEQYLRRLMVMREHGLLDRVLLSHDNGWYSVSEPDGGDFQPYTPLFTECLPALRNAGFTENEIRQLVVANPARAFTVRVRTQ